MPPDHKKFLQWNGERFISWAAKIGPKTETTVRAILGSYKIEQQGYKPCLALLKLADKYSAERLEAACAKALTYTPQPSFKNIKGILASGQDQQPEKQKSDTASDTSSQYGFTRGPEYYGGTK